MKKLATAAILLMFFTAGASSASLVPENMTVNVNLNLDGLFGGGEEQERTQEKENNTYGERVGGQSVHTEERSNDPPERRNTDEMKVSNDDVGGDPIVKFFSGLFS